ncbi:MAG: hypothetical protein EOP00_21170 [Pedobacter sp.]|nr:MAG: hypothetical protein EOP00_21170 [Pedobacter sp.]
MSRKLEQITEIIGWIQIVLSPTLFCSFIGSWIYYSNPNKTRLIVAILVILFGLIVGIIYATKIWKTKGTVWFVSRISATPELDKEKEEQ